MAQKAVDPLPFAATSQILGTGVRNRASLVVKAAGNGGVRWAGVGDRRIAAIRLYHYRRAGSVAFG